MKNLHINEGFQVFEVIEGIGKVATGTVHLTTYDAIEEMKVLMQVAEVKQKHFTYQKVFYISEMQ